MLRVCGLGVGVWDLGFKVSPTLGSMLLGFGFRARGVGCRITGLGFGV